MCNYVWDFLSWNFDHWTSCSNSCSARRRATWYLLQAIHVECMKWTTINWNIYLTYVKCYTPSAIIFWWLEVYDPCLRTNETHFHRGGGVIPIEYDDSIIVYSRFQTKKGWITLLVYVLMIFRYRRSWILRSQLFCHRSKLWAFRRFGEGELNDIFSLLVPYTASNCHLGYRKYI